LGVQRVPDNGIMLLGRIDSPGWVDARPGLTILVGSAALEELAELVF